MHKGTHYSEIYYARAFDDISVLEKNVSEHPASVVARFLLLYHYKKNSHPQFEKFAEQSSVYFSNHRWLQFQLTQNDLAPETGKEAIQASGTIRLEENELKEAMLASPADEEDTGQKSTGEIIHHGKEEEIYPTPAIAETTPQLLPVNQVTSSPDDAPAEQEIQEPNASNKNIQEEPPAAGPGADKVNADDLNNDTTGNGNTNDVVHTAEQGGNTGDSASFQPEAGIQAFTQTPDIDAPLLNAEEDSIKNISEEPPAANPEGGKINRDDLNNNTTGTANTNDIVHPAEEEGNTGDSASFQPEAGIQAFTQTPDIGTSSSGPAEEDLVSFEPLHTIDYFASQGIKIKEDAFTNDRLGEQVKSFTAWLKSMKKLHPNKLPEQNEVIEKIIQSSAEESNANADVLTEAMAEVLIKQDKKEKAMEMYQKLSLLNPSKRAYFAAKIESLKTN